VKRAIALLVLECVALLGVCIVLPLACGSSTHRIAAATSSRAATTPGPLQPLPAPSQPQVVAGTPHAPDATGGIRVGPAAPPDTSEPFDIGSVKLEPAWGDTGGGKTDGAIRATSPSGARVVEGLGPIPGGVGSMGRVVGGGPEYGALVLREGRWPVARA